MDEVVTGEAKEHTVSGTKGRKERNTLTVRDKQAVKTLPLKTPAN